MEESTCKKCGLILNEETSCCCEPDKCKNCCSCVSSNHCACNGSDYVEVEKA